MTTPAPSAPNPDQIWASDLFSRRAEAELLIRYIDAVAARQPLREDKKGYTISVDADYGIGKSFFLRRLSEHLSVDHAVAFVDAWHDDLADEPLIAIVSTLKKALNPYIVADAAVRHRWDAIATKTGEVAKIVTKGLIKKGLGLLITGAAVEAAELVMSEVPEESADIIDEAGRDAGAAAFDAFDKADPATLIGERIASFEAGKKAVDDLKSQLRQLVEMLSSKEIKLPIVIIVDELDRCRPTYAIKLLEEAKHLFDVPGVVFVFGMHADQLAHSVSGAYGPGFNGRAYLRRFIDREYTLPYPALEPLVEHIIQARGIDAARLGFPRVSGEGLVKPSDMVARYMRAYGLSARDAYGVMDILETSLAVTGTAALFMPLLLPLIFGQVYGIKNAAPSIFEEFGWTYTLNNNDGRRQDFHPKAVFDSALTMSSWSWQQIVDKYNRNDVIAGLLFSYHSPGQPDIALPTGYAMLLRTLAKFSIDEPN